MKLLVNKIIPFSSVDGPGNRTAVFSQGCNINCLYCHNPETINLCNNCTTCVSKCPTEALSLSNGIVKWNEQLCIDCDECIKVCSNNSSPKIIKYSVKQLLDEILKYKNFISGVTFSGGECTLYRDFITEISKKLRAENLSTFIDTNGFIDLTRDNLEFLEAIDSVMLDIKAWDEKEHIRLTGFSNKTVLENLKFLIDMNKLYEVRTVIVPNLLSNELTVKKVSQLIAETDIRYKIIQYRSHGVRKDLIKEDSPSIDEMKRLEQLAIDIGVKNVVII